LAGTIELGNLLSNVANLIATGAGRVNVDAKVADWQCNKQNRPIPGYDLVVLERLRFSIIVPAHNEEGYIADTLEHVAALSYPTDSYEVLVVENGSSDRTLEVAKGFERSNIRVFNSSCVGVSAAKNFGIDRMSEASDWVVFLDADTILEADFLNDLQRMVRGSGDRLTVGTTRVQPIGGGRRARAWFAYYDLAHRLGKGSYAIQIARRSLFPAIRFDEHLTMGEDLQLIKQARESGDFFFLPTDEVYTSTRRFDTVGYWRLFVRWTFVSVLPGRMQKLFGYDIIR
jgi:glycosyltransferase involved in cell wall biosynthesis